MELPAYFFEPEISRTSSAPILSSPFLCMLVRPMRRKQSLTHRTALSTTVSHRNVRVSYL